VRSSRRIDSRTSRRIGAHPFVLAMVGVLFATAPALADAIAGCVIPLVPRPDAFLERAWTPGELMTTLGRHAQMNFRTEKGEPIAVRPYYAVLVRDGGSRPVAAGQGAVTRLKPGAQPLARALGRATLTDAATAVERTLKRIRHRGRLMVTEARVLEHDEAVRWPRNDARIAVWFDVADARTREEPTRSHKLVVFLAPEESGDRLSAATGERQDENGGSPLLWGFALMAVAAFPVLRRRDR